jgi:CRP-like cAMP-binding protein
VPGVDRKLIEDLRASADLAGVGDKDLKALAAAGVVVNQPEGWAVIREGTPGDAAYVLLEGAADVVRAGTTLASLPVGAVFGEAAVLDRALRNASVITTAPSRLLHLHGDGLVTLLAKNPALRAAMGGAAARHAAPAQQ